MTIINIFYLIKAVTIVNNFVSRRIYFNDRSWHGGFAHEDYSAQDARIPGRNTQAFAEDPLDWARNGIRNGYAYAYRILVDSQ